MLDKTLCVHVLSVLLGFGSELSVLLGFDSELCPAGFRLRTV